MKFPFADRDSGLDEEAVSAVISVVIMVSVTTAMAAVAYAYFIGMDGRKNLEETPIIDFYQNDDQNTLTLTHTDRWMGQIFRFELWMEPIHNLSLRLEKWK